MIAGLSVSNLTTIHVVISLIAIALGLVAFLALARGTWLKRWHDWFLITTIATSVTGFFFPFKGITPAMVVGALSLVLLVVACVALYRLKLKGWGKFIYLVTGMLALYFNLFVLVIQSFQKIPSLNTLAPTGSEPPFAIVQGVVLIASIILSVAAFFGSRKISIET
jgi:CBS domain containing-hemolysin-like protein